jgi:hypothetical protein|nr:MAG TPA: Protein of unknown function (DUF3168) [Caudoviricetes sp.]DAY78532.1 MAG TPA: Protein of unknown function (DUF3168) [Caudoviricetes sp.]
MGPSESINRALSAFLGGFGVPAYLEDNIPPGATLPYLTYQPVIPGGWNESSGFHARLWYPSSGGRVPILQAEDAIGAALAGGLTVPCEGGAILLRTGAPWAQPLDNPPEGYLCEYLNFEITQFCE